MHFRIFLLLDPINDELISNGEETFLRFFQIGKITSSEFLKILSSSWIANADGPYPINATHIFNVSEIDSMIYVRLWKSGIF